MTPSNRETDWRGKRVIVLGIARQGKALARYLVEHGADVVLSDLRTAEELSDTISELEDLNLEFVLGEHPDSLLEGADLLCLSGGVPADLPLAQQARSQGIPLSNDSQIFFDLTTARTVGITGSAGKTTTTALLTQMAIKSFKQSTVEVWVGGNVGNPLLSDASQINKEDLVISELSSFQLELMTTSPNVAAVLNITPNHLDRHNSMQAYTEAKARILKFQTPDDIAVLCRDDPGAWRLRQRVEGELHSFGQSEVFSGMGAFVHSGEIYVRKAGETIRVMPVEAISLPGEHNLYNVLAAVTIGAALGFAAETMQAEVQSFPGVAHRLELVREVSGVIWINDSIATAPERTIAAINSFDQPIVLLVGGRDKDLPWEDLVKIINDRVDHLILFGELAERVSETILAMYPGQRPFTMDLELDLESAVQHAHQIAEPGEVVLLSPGGTSFDAFLDFEDRGNRYRELVSAL